MTIFKEKSKNLKAGISMGSAIRAEEETKGLHGRFFVKCYEAGSLVHEYVSDNVIVNTASILVASLLKDASVTKGISFLAVGTGGTNWSLQNPPAPTTAQTKLEAELFRKAINLSGNESTYVDPVTGEPTTTPTNVVDFAVTFTEAEAVGPLVEMALFGGDASLTKTGIMVNYRTFPVINKTASMSMSIIFRITA